MPTLTPDPQTRYFIPLGLVVYARQDDAPWVYVGYRVTSVGSRSHHFVRMLQMSRVPPYMYHYMATREATLKKKFVGLP